MAGWVLRTGTSRNQTAMVSSLAWHLQLLPYEVQSGNELEGRRRSRASQVGSTEQASSLGLCRFG